MSIRSPLDIPLSVNEEHTCTGERLGRIVAQQNRTGFVNPAIYKGLEFATCLRNTTVAVKDAVGTIGKHGLARSLSSKKQAVISP